MFKKSTQILQNAIILILAFFKKAENSSCLFKVKQGSFKSTSQLGMRALLMASFILSSATVLAQTTVLGTYTTSGTQTFVVPTGVTSITVSVWGGGGRGGERQTLLGLGGGGVAGGGGGAYSLQTVSVTPGQILTLNVGNGSNSTAAGGDSWVSTTAVVANAVVLAKGGSSVPQNGGTGAIGGLASSGIGSTKYNGGNGSNTAGANGGGGGSSAGTGANGTNSVTTSTGAVAPLNGGNGGNGATSAGSGNNGTFPGGAGGGGKTGCLIVCTGGGAGNGAAGQVIISCSDIGVPVFALGASSTICQGANSITYTATSSNTTNLTYTLDAASLAAGNVINATTGQVTYAATWSGTSIITVDAVGCAGPKTASHTVTVNPGAGIPVFALGATSQRCAGAGTATYVATSANSTGIVYTLDATSLAAGNTISSTTGQVTYVSTWSGVSTITATASGCGVPAVSTHQANSGGFFVNDDFVSANQGIPVSFNVLGNDLCNINPASVTITQQPTGGFLTLGASGQMTYVSFGAFVGTDTAKYQVCSNGPTVTCKTATISIVVSEVPDDACFQANKEKTYYLPFPENDTQLKQSLLSAASVNLLTANVRNITSISLPYPGTHLTYDQWEDGYEADIKNPVQSTTQIWGDGNTSNGVAPGYPTDIIPAGGFITLDNSFAWNRPTSDLRYDGKDKLFSTANISVSKVTGDAGFNGATPLFNVQTVKTNVSDVTKFGNFFVLPFGENITAGPSSTTAFNYTGLFVRAKQSGTIVQLDYDGNGTYDVTSPTLGEGEVWFYNGTGSTPGAATDVNKLTDIKAGARVNSNNPVGVDLVFGGIDSYGTRNIPVLPSQFYGSTYYSPVYSTNGAAPAVAYFVNPSASAITINWSRSVAPLSGSFTVPANNGLAFFNMDKASGTKFVSAGNESYTAVVVLDADNAGSAYDWAFNMIPEKRLTSAALVAWAPGSSDLSANYNPVWVTPKATTTVYVKYDGNVTTGPNLSPCGGYYDVSYVVNALQSKQIFGPSVSNDNSGMAVYNCDNTPMSMIWGQNSETTTPAGSPALDVGYSMEPKCFEKIAFATDDKVVTPQNTPITINVASNDNGFLVLLDAPNITIVTQPTNGTLVINASGTITYTPNAGFTGNDSFEYRICGKSPDNNVCDIATVLISVPCAIVTETNVISGTVYNDVNVNAAPDGGEPGISAINVELYDDLNKNGVLDTGEPLLQTQASTSGANAGSFQFNIPNKTYIDQFNTNGSPSGTNGTVTWTPVWTKIVDAGAFNVNNIQVVGNRLQIQGNGNASQAGAYRTADLTGAGEAELSFDFNKSTFSDATNDWVDLQVASTVGGAYTTLARYSGTVATSGTGLFTIPSALISATTTIRFVESTNNGFSTAERVTFDNVKIRYVLDKKYIVKLASPIANSWAQTSTPLTTVVGIKNFSDGDCSSKFGLAKSDIAITKTVNNANPIFGSNVTFTLTANNAGPSDAPSVTVSDALPTGYTFVSSTPSIGTYTGGVWTIGTLTNGATATLTIVATVKNTGDYTNTAVISTTGNDPNLTNNTSSVTPLAQMDSDGDGIGDFVDLDDDNDGILDTAEGYTCGSDLVLTDPNPTSNNVFASPPTTVTLTENTASAATVWTYTPAEFPYGGGKVIDPGSIGSKVTYTFAPNVTNLDFWLMDLDNQEIVNINYYDANGNRIANLLPYVTQTVTASVGSLGLTNNATYGLITNPTNNIGSHTPMQDMISIKTPFSISKIEIYFSGAFFGTATPYYFIKAACAGIDTDGDGIPDYLDLDSDNDGCLDAIEGSADISSSQLVNSGGTVVVGSGSTASNQNLCASGACVNAQGLPQLSPLPTGYSNTTGQGVGSAANNAINACICYNPAAGGTGVATNHGITLLQKAGVTNTDWPMVRTSAHTVLESNTKGFVITRMTSDPSKTADANHISKITNPQDGMMVYDTFTNCLKIYTVEVLPAVTGWKCYLVPTCP